MKKVSNKVYNAIVTAKEVVAHVCDEGAMGYIEACITVAQNTATMKAPALMKEALLTVLTSGTVSENGFNMPSTAYCCENYKLTCKQMKRRSLRLFVFDPDNDDADEDGYLTIPFWGSIYELFF